MQSNAQVRNIHKLYRPPPPQDYSKNYVRLAVVIVIATIFIAVEIIGGTIAKSIAIISDAIHLVSDLLGFAFSFLFLYLSKKEMDEKVSFGYHRMELIGALANIFIVWTMVLFIIFEATLRIINKEFVEKPAIMLITAIAGLLINIILYKILHGGASHSHGLMADEHDHSHSHGSSEIEGSQVCSDECNDENCNRTVKETHCHRGNDKSVHRHGKIKMDSAFNPTINNGLTDRLNEEYCEEKHQHTNTCYLRKEVHNQKHVCSGHHKEGHSHDAPKPTAHEHHDHDHHDHEHHDHKHQPKQTNQHDHHEHDHEHDHHDHDDHDDHDHQAHAHESIGMKSAVLHALSDLVQSVGVVLSAIVIYFYGSNNGQEVTEWNAYHLFDPIATYLFSILSLIATLPVVRNCYYLIMESTPAHLNLDDLRREFEKIEGVIDVHDIHVWDLKPGKTLMIAHVLAKKDTERGVLTRLTDLCRKKRIYHSTFQVQQQQLKDDDDYILCHHDIH